MNNRVILLKLMLLLILISCIDNTDENNENNNAFKKRKLQKKEYHEDRLKGKTIKGVRKIFKNQENNKELEYHILFLYKNTDCKSCIDEVFHIIDTLDSKLKHQRVIILTRDSSILSNNYKKSYKINKVLDSEEINSLYTPFLALITPKTYIIKDIYISIFGLNQNKERKQFVDKVTQLCNKNISSLSDLKCWEIAMVNRHK